MFANILTSFVRNIDDSRDFSRDFFLRVRNKVTIGYAMTHFSGELPNITSGFPRKSCNERSTL